MAIYMNDEKGNFLVVSEDRAEQIFNEFVELKESNAALTERERILREALERMVRAAHYQNNRNGALNQAMLQSEEILKAVSK